MNTFQKKRMDLKDLAASDLDEGIKEVKKLMGANAGEFEELFTSIEEFRTQAKLALLKKDHNAYYQHQDKALSSLLNIIDNLPEEHFSEPATTDTTQKSQEGHIFYRIPKKMGVNQETKCLVRMSFEELAILQDLEIEGQDQLKKRHISDYMRVELIDPSGNDSSPPFEIRTISTPSQSIDAETYTEWLFYVKPLKAGTYPLVIMAAVIDKTEGQERVREIPLDEIVEVITEPVEETIPEGIPTSELKPAMAYSFSMIPLAGLPKIKGKEGKPEPKRSAEGGLSIGKWVAGIVAGLALIAVIWNFYPGEKSNSDKPENGEEIVDPPEPPPEEQPDYQIAPRITGQVLDQQGNPLSEVQVVQVDGTQSAVDIQTDNAGQYILQLPPDFPSPDINLRYSKEGYQTKTSKMTLDGVTSLPPTDLQIMQRPPTTLKGTVVDAANKPLRGIQVASGYGNTSTDEGGRFELRFEDNENYGGTLMVTFSGGAYKTSRQNIPAPAGKVTEKKITLEKSPTPPAPALSYGEVKDPDNASYKTLQLEDGRTWMVENLNYVADQSWCFREKPDNCTKYGRLYLWETAKKACEELTPGRWTLPTAEEWNNLINAYGDGVKAYEVLSKESIGFKTQGGYIDYTTGEVRPRSIGSSYYWSRTDSEVTNQNALCFTFSGKAVEKSTRRKNHGLSCRCIKK